MKIPEFCLRYYREKKTHRGSEHYLELSGRVQELQNEVKLYERF